MEITNEEAKKYGNRREFRHKEYPKIVIAFDKGNPDDTAKGDKAFSKTDHWHRYNPHPDKKCKWQYIDKWGKPIAGQNKNTHIVTDRQNGRQ